MLGRIKEYQKSGFLFEATSFNFHKKIRKIINQSYRINIKRVKRKFSKRIDHFYKDKKEFNDLYKQVVGNFSRYNHYIKDIQKKKILKLADYYMNHYFDILGSGSTKLDPIDWHIDFKSGYRWNPGKFYSDYVQVDLSNNADVKVPRELSRCHHFLILGQAYLITGNEKYTEEFIYQILKWIDENPLMYSINWGCTMDVAIRAVNWIYALGMFIKSEKINDRLLKIILSSLFQHGYFIYRNQERAFINNNNHYDSDLVGMLILGLVFRVLEEPKRWLTESVEQLKKEMRSQILPSGAIYERTTNYNRLVMELFTTSYILMKKNNIEIPLDIEYRIEKMYEFVLHYIKPDGMAPIIGDQDDGRLLSFGNQRNIDHRYLLTVGAVLFKRADFKSYSNGYNADTFFLLGEESYRKFNELENKKISLESKAFKDAGFFIQRKNDHYMFIVNSGKPGYSDMIVSDGGGHSHCDLLSFELCIGAQTFIVDPGSYVYSSSPEDRKLFRSTRMHNTVLVDGFDQNELKTEELFHYKRMAIPKLNEWVSNDKYDLFDGEHSGFQRIENPVVHRRKFFFDKKKMEWEIVDYLRGKGKHVFEWFFHFNSDLNAEIKQKRIKVKNYKGKAIEMLFLYPGILKIETESSWISKSYGLKEKASALKVILSTYCPVEFKTIIRKDFSI